MFRGFSGQQTGEVTIASGAEHKYEINDPSRYATVCIENVITFISRVI